MTQIHIKDFPNNGAAMHFKMRGLHPIIDDGVIIFDDPIAVELQSKLNSNDDYMLPVWKKIRSNSLFRSRVTEWYLLKELVLTGTQQYIILGAGLDTFSNRKPEWAKNLNVYNVDLSYVLSARESLLGNYGINVACDLRNLTLSKLEEHGFDVNKPSFFSLLGVSMYLDHESQKRLYSEISRLNNVSLVITYMGFEETPILQTVTKAVDLIGEPFIGKIREDDLIAMLKNAGFTTVKNPEKSMRDNWYKGSLLPKPNLKSLIIAKKL